MSNFSDWTEIPSVEEFRKAAQESTAPFDTLKRNIIRAMKSAVRKRAYDIDVRTGGLGSHSDEVMSILRLLDEAGWTARFSGGYGGEDPCIIAVTGKR